MRRWMLIAGWVVLMGGGGGAVAGEPGDLQKQLDELKAKVDALEAKKGPPEAAKEKKDLWTERLKFSADLRLRFENVEEDGKRDRERGRFRARVGFAAAVNEETDFRFRLTTCNDGSPVSCYQTFGSAQTKKPVWVDQAYIDYHPQVVPGLNLLGGKMEMPFFVPGKNEMIWDANLTPEGAAVKYALPEGRIRPFAVIGGFWIEERENDRDSGLFGGQGGVKVLLPVEGAYLTVGGGYFDFANLKGLPTLWKAASGCGNTLDGASHYLYDFDEVEAFAELGFRVLGLPVTIFGDFVKNLDADAEDQGLAAGLCLGQLAKPGDLAFRYDYREVEKDAVVGLYSERGTDRRGHEFGLEVQAMRNVQAGVVFCMDEVGIADGGDEHDYRRLRLQVTFKF